MGPMSTELMVIAEQLEGRLAEVTFELLGCARQLADELGGWVSVALLGSGDPSWTESLGAAEVVLWADAPELAEYTPEAYVEVLEGIVAQRTPHLVLLANTSMGMDLAAPLAARRQLPLVAYCRKLWAEEGKVVAQSQVYGGRLVAEVVLEGPAVVSVLPGSYPADAGKSDGSPRVEKVAVALPDRRRTRFVRLIQPEAGEVDITREEVLVAVGRGIGEKENLHLVEELAAALGGAVCASRPLVDNGWLPKDRQVGKSGLTVKPKLYVAVGISGAPEHVEGMKDSELIIAINTDPRAPIFDVAHYGVVGDALEILPVLTEAVKRRKG